MLSTTVGGQLTTTNAYDTGGRLIRQVSAAGVVTQYAYANGGQVVTETLAPGTADETSKTTAYYADGRVQSITGTAVINEYHTYDFDANGRPRETVNYGTSHRPQQGHRPRPIGPGAENGPARLRRRFLPARWECSPARDLHELQLAGTAVRHLFCPAFVRRLGATDQAHQLTEYDEFGVVSASGLDLDGDGTLSATGPDRFVASTANTFAGQLGPLVDVTTTNKLYRCPR